MKVFSLLNKRNLLHTFFIVPVAEHDGIRFSVMKQNATMVDVYDRPEMEVINLSIESSLCQQVSPGHNEGTSDEEVTP